jgi:hypothetical protein
LEELIGKKVGIKDLVVCILCSADYYDKSEINQVLAEMDNLYRLKPVQRKKRQADYLIGQCQWKEAMKEYQNILNSKEFAELSSEEYGDILHNMGVLEARTGAFVVAANKFLEAYERNNKEESLKQYLYALKLSRQESIFEREVKLYVGTREMITDIEEELYRVDDCSEYTSLYTDVMHLKELKEQGKIKDYYLKVDEITDQLKNRYRHDSL